MIGQLVTITDQKAVTTPLVAAEAFEKKHMHVLRAIRTLECSEEFNQSNFGLISYLDDRNRPQPAYQITRDGFTFLAMGFTGRRAAEFKEKFISAFNAMEQALLEDQGERRRVDVNHSRGFTNPHGLDVQYRLDLTKIIIRPTPEGLEILQRLTGIDMSGIIPPAAAGVAEDVARWIGEQCLLDPAATLTAREAYFSFLNWMAQNTDNEPPSRKRFGEAMTRLGYRKDRGGPGGSFRYHGLGLSPDSRHGAEDLTEGEP